MFRRGKGRGGKHLLADPVRRVDREGPARENHIAAAGLQGFEITDGPVPVKQQILHRPIEAENEAHVGVARVAAEDGVDGSVPGGQRREPDVVVALSEGHLRLDDDFLHVGNRSRRRGCLGYLDLVGVHLGLVADLEFVDEIPARPGNLRGEFP